MVLVLKYIGYWILKDTHVEKIRRKQEEFKTLCAESNEYPLLLSEDYCFCNKPEGFTLVESDCRAKLDKMKQYYQPEMLFEFSPIREGVPQVKKTYPSYQLVWIEGLSRPVSRPMNLPKDFIEK